MSETFIHFQSFHDEYIDERALHWLVGDEHDDGLCGEGEAQSAEIGYADHSDLWSELSASLSSSMPGRFLLS